MEITQILENIDAAIQSLLDAEQNTLKRGLSERTISSHFANHLKPLFEGYNVDPDYNGDIDKPNDTKALSIARNRMLEIGILPNEDDEYQLSPDIIIHKQGTNEDNLVVIEVKKDVSRKKYKEFDLIKLEHLTIDYLGNHYKYKVGIAITFGTGESTGQVTKTFFQAGQQRSAEDLQ
jgi:hypothetical protein